MFSKNLNKLKKFYTPELIFLAILIVLMPFYLAIDFQHNDDWVYYLSVQNFQEGNFKLHPYIAATTYTQTWMGYLFGFIFNLKYLPILTLFVSILCVYILFKILQKRLNFNLKNSFLISMLLLVNGLFVFTSIGFMTDNYFLLFILASFYIFTEESLSIKNKKFQTYLKFFLGIIFVVLAYFTRQLGLLIPLTFFIYKILNKKYYDAIFHLVTFMVLSFYHFFIFPIGHEALETKIVLSNLDYVQYVYSFTILILFYCFYFLLPIAMTKIEIKPWLSKKIIILALLTIFALIFNNFYFKRINWINDSGMGFIYSLRLKGFFVENVHGIKSYPNLLGSYYFVAKPITYFLMFLSIFAILLSKKLKEFFTNPYFIFLVLYTGTLLLAVKVYDRYLIPLITIAILFFASFLENKVLSSIRRYFLMFILLVNFVFVYNYASDYILTNSYIWNKSFQLVKEKGATPNNITATDLWRYVYPRTKEIYKFTYDNPSLQNYSQDFELIEKYDISYPGKLLNNSIYLYKKK